ncbi:MAG TPA: GAF domain-containing protein [Candidatus Hydrogenedentes bacterium]|nr:GAF domain-containing protein [Candidatus Hydrogenedentota bacterium]
MSNQTDLAGISEVQRQGTSMVVRELLGLLRSVLCAEATLYDVEGHTLPVGEVELPGEGIPRAVLHTIIDEEHLTTERQKAVGACSAETKPITYYYEGSPLVELFAPVRMGDNVIAVLASGPLVVRELEESVPPPIPKKELACIEAIPKILLNKRLEWTEEAAVCMEKAIAAASQWETAIEALKAVTSSKNSREICKNLLKQVIRAVGAEVGTILFSDDEERELRVVAHEGSPINKWTFLIKIGEPSVCWDTFKRGGLLHVPDVQDYQAKGGGYYKQWDKTCSEMAAPIMYRDRRMGVLNVESSRRDAFSNNDETVIEAFAKIAAIALVKREHIREATVFRELAEAVARETDLAKLLRKIMKSITKATHARVAYLFLREEGDEKRGKNIVLRATTPGWEGQIGKLSYAPGEGFTGFILKKKQGDFLIWPKKGQKGYSGKGFDKYLKEKMPEKKIITLAAAPLILPSGEAIGVITLINRDEEAASPYFGTQETELLRTLANTITLSITHTRSLAILEQMSQTQQTGLSIIKCPENIGTIENPNLEAGLCMTIRYANKLQSENFPDIEVGKSICYRIYNHDWEQDKPCPWCPCLRVLMGKTTRAMAVTHSPTPPHKFIRHYMETATPFRDNITGEIDALETIVDVTDSVELQYLFEQLVRASEPRDVALAVCATLGVVFQALEGLLFIRTTVGWRILTRFRYDEDDSLEQGKAILARLYYRMHEDPLTAYLDERMKAERQTFHFENGDVDKPLSETIISWLEGRKGEIGFVDVLPDELEGMLSQQNRKALLVLPIPINNPSFMIIFAENGESEYFPSLKNAPEHSPLRSLAIATSNQAIYGAQLALDKMRESETLRKSAEFLEFLRKNIPKHGLEQCFVNYVPKLLNAKNFSLFYVDPADGLLRLKTTTRLFDGNGHLVAKEEWKNVTYRVSPEDGLTGWVAYYGHSLSVPRRAFQEGALRELFEREIKPYRPDIDRQPVWKGKYNENPPTEHSYLAVPIKSSSGDVIGVARVTGKTQSDVDDFDSNDQALFEVFCLLLGSMKELERDVAKTERRMGATFAHRIGNVLPPAQYRLRMIQANKSVDERVREDTDVALDAVNDVFRIVRDYKAYAGRTDLHLVKHDFVQLIQSVIGQCRVQYPHLFIQIENEVPGGMIVRAYPSALADVFRSFVMDSIRFHLSSNPKICIRCTLEDNGHKLRIEYADDGPGIPDDRKQLIFVPFFTSAKDGSGLGLSDALNIVQMHNGTLYEDGKAGCGVRFVITLPIEEEKGD